MTTILKKSSAIEKKYRQQRPCSQWKDFELSLERYHSVPGLEEISFKKSATEMEEREKEKSLTPNLLGVDIKDRLGPYLDCNIILQSVMVPNA